MTIIIKKLSVSNIGDINKCDSAFVINSKLIPHYEPENRRILYNVVPVTEYVKQYGPHELYKIDYSSYIGSADNTAFIAYVDGRVAGQIVVSRNWNRFSSIEDIRVDAKFRRQGIGRALLKHAETWVRKNSFPGIMVETQDTNVGACRFYEKYGFVLGGFDTHLYHAADKYRDDIALFWYLVFPPTNIT